MSRALRYINISSTGVPTETSASAADEPMSETQALVHDAAAIVRTIYIHCRRRFTGQFNYGDERSGALPWDGEGADAWGRRRANAWPRLAAHIARLAADPMTYITAQFWYTRQNECALAPTQMLCAAAVERYKRYAQDLHHELLCKLTREISSIRVMSKVLSTALNWDPLEAMRQALYDVGQVEASPLCRYCVAMEYNLPDVAEHYKQRALVQYAFQRHDYDKAWAGCIPELFKAEGTALAARLIEPRNT